VIETRWTTTQLITLVFLLLTIGLQLYTIGLNAGRLATLIEIKDAINAKH
jgi:hypothetical protein